MLWRVWRDRLGREIKEEARRLGFVACGIARVEPLGREARWLELWLKNGFHGAMKYMEKWFDLRVDPARFLPGARSVICVVVPYWKSTAYPHPFGPKIARYAQSTDYHLVVRKRLERLCEFIRRRVGEWVALRVFVDSAPVMERVWARRAGLGWQGRHSLLITRRWGSYVFIGGIMTDLELEPDAAFTDDLCGTCTRCMDACPTGAIVAGGVVDARLCISYITIEYRGQQIPSEFRGRMDGWLFGCDICQEVCPWNRFARPATIEELEYRAERWAGMDWEGWEQMGSSVFKRRFGDTPLRRAGLRVLKRNLAAIRE